MTVTTVDAPERVTLAAVMADIGATARQVDFWVRSGYLHPERDGDGSGYWYSWPPEELDAARLMSALVNNWGVTAAGAARLARSQVDRAALAVLLATVDAPDLAVPPHGYGDEYLDRRAEALQAADEAHCCGQCDYPCEPLIDFDEERDDDD